MYTPPVQQVLPLSVQELVLVEQEVHTELDVHFEHMYIYED